MQVYENAFALGTYIDELIDSHLLERLLVFQALVRVLDCLKK